MKEKFDKIKTQLMLLGAIELIALITFNAFLNNILIYLQYSLVLLNLLIIFILYTIVTRNYRERVLTVSRVLGRESGEAYAFGKLAILTYDDSGIITWMSEVFDEYNLTGIGEQLTRVFPQTRPLMDGLETTQFVEANDYMFEVGFISEGVLVFQEKTEVGELRTLLNDNQVVLGLAHLDNYEETTAYEEEQTIAYIDMNIRQAVVKWADQHDMFIRRLRSDRYLLVLNEKIFRSIQNERFSILNEVRKGSSKIDASITLSLAFARKSDQYKELEDMSNKALELAQSRGGDQVAINTKNESIRYYGGSVEAVEKRSKVRVRVLAQNLGEAIQNASDVIIVGHRMMDFDCFGSALGVASIAKVYDKVAYVLFDEQDTEGKLLEAIGTNQDLLKKQHKIITPQEAQTLMSDKTLLIMVDHHTLEQSQAPKLIERAQSIVIIDHHRRMGEFNFKPRIAYIEPSASSASELVVELFPYHKRNVVVSRTVATFMYTGMLIDTNRFRNRSGSRTFEAASELRKFGADLSETENMLRDEYEDFALKNRVLSHGELYDDGFVIAAYKDGYLSRSLMSQVADELTRVRNVEASFVVAYIRDDTVAISARSKGDMNVQRVMEKLGGGGHFTGAAAQIVGQSINDVVEQLKSAILEIKEEVEE